VEANGTPLSLFQLPHDPHLRSAWLQNSKTNEPQDAIERAALYRGFRICSSHFAVSALGFFRGKRRVLPGQVPTIFNAPNTTLAPTVDSTNAVTRSFKVDKEVRAEGGKLEDFSYLASLCTPDPSCSIAKGVVYTVHHHPSSFKNEHQYFCTDAVPPASEEVLQHVPEDEPATDDDKEFEELMSWVVGACEQNSKVETRQRPTTEARDPFFVVDHHVRCSQSCICMPLMTIKSCFILNMLPSTSGARPCGTSSMLSCSIARCDRPVY
jgi:hypothetical protein